MTAAVPTRQLGQAAALLLWLTLLAAVFAHVEIQIEGPAGWAANLPTWRLDNSWLNALWGGKTITGYHVCVFAFMALVFHLPLFVHGTFSARLEARLLGGLMIFWIVEDFLWFVFNPAFGLAGFQPHRVPWHHHWVWHVPVDYVVALAAGVALFAWSYGRRVAPPAKPEGVCP